ncbi:MAG: hypothetical protein L6R39_004194 [Caloplaca ligustica]|nr:MAG: hypothetical protein L6R39_004194 [Caloplaca ligustica]
MPATTNLSTSDQIITDIQDTSVTDTREVIVSVSQLSTGNGTDDDGDSIMEAGERLEQSLEQKNAIHGEDTEETTRPNLRKIEEIYAEVASLELKVKTSRLTGPNIQETEEMFAEVASLESKVKASSLTLAKIKAQHRSDTKVFAKVTPERQEDLRIRAFRNIRRQKRMKAFEAEKHRNQRQLAKFEALAQANKSLFRRLKPVARKCRLAVEEAEAQTSSKS